ncbi:hypothetical protein NCER_100339 [Vairimorpha ceranae BRL01]|uniref:Uncharacterized protein n=2 Tax=Vairimorpha ceranae TaxID=40302 RepID=C4V7B5_VAIC1|nr:hypothetical protein AAJ76_600085575 [Vairimorpha ceranae]EEQ82890.1 hypothetical protein NCER_100339 [Vairimorpha ceranae BRL01]KAF5140061.1 hypothetical protein G9O61_00g017860 [Vairimorpha ceranae]KKO76169.1 hypothetical protein AAJ76_600085575 [Vairimorpha ceranae]
MIFLIVINFVVTTGFPNRPSTSSDIFTGKRQFFKNQGEGLNQFSSESSNLDNKTGNNTSRDSIELQPLTNDGQQVKDRQPNSNLGNGVTSIEMNDPDNQPGSEQDSLKNKDGFLTRFCIFCWCCIASIFD